MRACSLPVDEVIQFPSVLFQRVVHTCQIKREGLHGKRKRRRRKTIEARISIVLSGGMLVEGDGGQEGWRDGRM